MAKLTTKERKDLPTKDFVEKKDRKFPIENESHARNALARSSGKPEAGKVKAAVERKFPDIKVDGKGNVQSRGGRPRERMGTSDGHMVRGKKK